jgi:hypothetical protein
MPQNNTQVYIEYLESFQHPVEGDFFTADQFKQLEDEKKSLESTRNYVASIAEKPDFEDLLQRSIIDGKIYGASQFAYIKDKLKTFEEGLGEREDIPETLVSPSGQRIIMSRRLQDVLGFDSDGYLTRESADKLAKGLQSDGVAGPQIDKVNSAMNKYNVIILQRGVFSALKDMLIEALGRNFITPPAHVQPVSAPVKEEPAVSPGPAKHGQSKILGELPKSFIDYLKKNEPGYANVVSTVSKDAKFIEFFSNLKKHYTYYQNLSAEKMVEEIFIRPVLWSKLSQSIKEIVEGMVLKHKDAFEGKPKVKEEHGASITDLKAKLVGKPQPTPFEKELQREVNTPELTKAQVAKVKEKPPLSADEPQPIEAEFGDRKPEMPNLEKNAWMISSKVVVPKSSTVITPSPLNVPRIRNRIARYGLPELNEINTVEDLGLLEPAHLRQRPLAEQINFIRNRISELAKKNHIMPVNILPIFEQSPLFQTYLKAGALLIDKNVGEAKYNIDHVMQEMGEGMDDLSQEEFEAVADLKKDLEAMAGL